MKQNNNIFTHGKDFFGQVLLNPRTLSRIAVSIEIWNEILSFHHEIATDEYVEYLNAYYIESLSRYRDNWYYLDIVNTVYAAAKITQPTSYLEIGVRRGRSVCTVARAAPQVDIYAFDLWQQNYAGMDNPGPDFVRGELLRVGHKGSISFFNGNSHITIPQFFNKNPELKLDMITVDGDHTEIGALQDLMDVIPHLALGGILVFDDISHPSHPYLLNVWNKVMSAHPELSSYEYTESGYGLAFAIKSR